MQYGCKENIYFISNKKKKKTNTIIIREKKYIWIIKDKI